jgi:hypothetical protein
MKTESPYKSLYRHLPQKKESTISQRNQEAFLQLERLLSYACMKELPIQNGFIEFELSFQDLKCSSLKLKNLRDGMLGTNSSGAYDDLEGWDSNDDEISKTCIDTQKDATGILLGELMGLVTCYEGNISNKGDCKFRLKVSGSYYPPMDPESPLVDKRIFRDKNLSLFRSAWKIAFQQYVQHLNNTKQLKQRGLQIEQRTQQQIEGEYETLNRFLLRLNYTKQEEEGCRLK